MEILDNTEDFVVDEIIRELNGRGGFDHWWGNIREDDRAGIVESLRAIVRPFVE